MTHEEPARGANSAPHDPIICIDHLAVAVNNLEEAIDWYTAKLGFRLCERRVTRGRHTEMLSAVLSVGQVVVVLVQGTSHASQVSRFVERHGAGVQHVAFRVRSLQETLGRVRHAGGQADTEVIQDVGIRQVFLKREDGSGPRIELIERNGGNFTDASVERLFRTFEEKDLY